MTYKGVTPSWQWLEVEIDFGSKPVSDMNFHIVNADIGVRSNTQVAVLPSGNAPTGLTSDEWQMDQITFAAVADVAGGGFTLYASASSLVSGKRKIFYQVT